MQTRIETRFETIFNHVNEGILIADSKGIIILANPKVNQMFGYSDGELVGKAVEVLVPRELGSGHVGHRESYMRHPVKRPMGKNMILHGQSRDNRKFPVEISLSYYETSDGIYAIAFIIDITERFEQQEKFKRINAELKSLNESLERKVGERTLVLREALQELENSRDELSNSLEKEKELNEMKTRFISMASHEFRTPLSTIMSSVSLIGKYPKEEDQEKREKHINRIKNAVSGLTEILNDFLSIGKLEEGKIIANLATHDINALIDEVITEIQPICKVGQVITFTDGTPLNLMVDKQMIRNVMFNLLSNAIKFSPEDSEIQVVTGKADDHVVISVADHGIGISDEDKLNLFERFFRGRNVSNIQGTGLGLHIVAKYLELLNGDISFISELGIGTTFTFRIPLQNS
ncbi:MAG: PAS domain-containing sensor histidine kinase [Flavobacteriales bacterium]|nr:PAS domain-containing sensor histidine kinase [Flavobacteriales bacterium]